MNPVIHRTSRVVPFKALAAGSGARIEKDFVSQIVVYSLMRFYRYFDKDGGEKTLESRRIRWADPRGFNDPFELLPRMNPPTREEVEATLLSGKQIERHFQEKGRPLGMTREQSEASYREQIPEKVNRALQLPKNEANKIRKLLIEHASRKFKLLCGSKTHESVLMWSHYAEKHKGIVIEIESSELIRNQSIDHGFHEVVYRSSPPTLPPMPWSDEDWFLAMTEIFRTKALFWSYEEEVRFQMPLIPEIPLSQHGDIEFQPHAVKSVIIGCRAGTVFQRKISSILESEDYKHVRIFLADVNEKDYKLEFAELRPPYVL